MEEETPRSPSQMEEHLAMPLTQKNPFSSSTIQVLFLGPDIHLLDDAILNVDISLMGAVIVHNLASLDENPHAG